MNNLKCTVWTVHKRLQHVVALVEHKLFPCYTMNLSPRSLQAGLDLSVWVCEICSLQNTHNCYNLVFNCYHLRWGNVIVWFALFDPIGYATLYSNRSLCRLQMGDGEGALSDAYKCRMMRPDWAKGCYRMAAAHMLLGVRYTPTLPKCRSLLIHIIFIWFVVVLYVWTCCVLGAQASLWRSSGCAEVGSWKRRDWERTTVITCYLLFVLDMIRILNVSLVGTPGGPTVWVMCLADLFPYLTAVSLVHHIYM
jgi:hypothetical protein